LWEANDLLGADLCSYNDGTAASTEYQALSGCTSTIPVERDGGAGTACGHWDEVCYQGELMTGFATDGLEISRATVGTLEDMGYVVDYCQADTFPVSNLDASCVCSSIISRRAVSNEDSNDDEHRRHKLSDEGRNAAFEYGRQYLKNKSIKRENMKEDEGIIYLGDQYVIILYLEEGEVYGVDVTSHDV
jgi:hypothetical protein